MQSSSLLGEWRNAPAMPVAGILLPYDLIPGLVSPPRQPQPGQRSPLSEQRIVFLLVAVVLVLLVKIFPLPVVRIVFILHVL